jgi:hypothetical protein
MGLYTTGQRRDALSILLFHLSLLLSRLSLLLSAPGLHLDANAWPAPYTTTYPPRFVARAWFQPAKMAHGIPLCWSSHDTHVTPLAAAGVPLQQTRLIVFYWMPLAAATGKPG